MSNDRVEFRPLYRPLIDLIKQKRIKLGISQTELAVSAGYSRKYVTLIESGERTPSVEALFAIAARAGIQRAEAEKVCGTILDQFTWGDPEEN